MFHRAGEICQPIFDHASVEGSELLYRQEKYSRIWKMEFQMSIVLKRIFIISLALRKKQVRFDDRVGWDMR